jgi:hypothetical protein
MRHRTVLCTPFVLCTAAVAAPAVEPLVVLTSGHDSDHLWSAQQVVGDDATNTCGNPCPLLNESTGRLWLRLTHPIGIDRERAIAVRTAPGLGTVGSSNPTAPDKTCKFGARIRPMVNDCQVAELFDGGGTLLFTLRSTHGRNVHAPATARAGGATSSPITAADGLVDPLWPASLIRHETKPGAGGDLVCSQPAAHPRLQLTVKTRADAGRTSRELAVLVPGVSAYSNLVSLAPDTVGCRAVNGEKRA